MSFGLASFDAQFQELLSDPSRHDILTLVKGARNGVVYGTKMRFPHSLVLTFLFHSGTLRQKARKIFEATRQHACGLGLYVLVYKTAILLLRQLHLDGKQHRMDSFWAGLLGGYLVFGRSYGPINQQIVMYVFTRTVLALAKLAVSPQIASKASDKDGMREKLRTHAWPAFASFMWASIMYLFTWYPQHLTSSSWSQMNYLFNQSEQWDSFETLLLRNTKQVI